MDTEIIDRGRGPEIKGTRITVYDVYHYLEDGTWPVEEIAKVLRLSSEQVRAAVAYIEANKADVLEVHRQIEERIARGNPPEIEAKLEASRKKRQALLEQIRNSKQEKNGAGDPR